MKDYLAALPIRALWQVAQLLRLTRMRRDQTAAQPSSVQTRSEPGQVAL